MSATLARHVQPTQCGPGNTRRRAAQAELSNFPGIAKVILLPPREGFRQMHSHLRAGFIIVALSVTSTVLAQSVHPPADSTTAAVTTLRWTTEQAAGQWRGTKLIGLNVYNNDNEKIGGITEIIVDESGKLDAVVVGAGGFLGLGEHDVAVPYDQITWMYLPGAQSPANPPVSREAANTAERNSEGAHDAARDLVGIWCRAISGNMKVSFQAARSIG
jgi:sporulation protein YlmC with PRC-barrel domain